MNELEILTIVGKNFYNLIGKVCEGIVEKFRKFDLPEQGTCLLFSLNIEGWKCRYNVIVSEPGKTGFYHSIPCRRPV